MMYEYRCTACGREFQSTLRAECLNADCCSAKAQRVWGFGFKRPMAAHFNHSVGQYVTNESKFSDALKQKSEERTEATGIPHNYAPVDISDRKSLGVTDEGLTRNYTP